MTENAKTLEAQDGLGELFPVERGMYTYTAGSWSIIWSPRIKKYCFKIECMIGKGYQHG